MTSLKIKLATAAGLAVGVHVWWTVVSHYMLPALHAAGWVGGPGSRSWYAVLGVVTLGVVRQGLKPDDPPPEGPEDSGESTAATHGSERDSYRFPAF